MSAGADRDLGAGRDPGAARGADAAAAGSIDPRQLRALLRATLRMRMHTGGRMLAPRSRKPRGLIFLLVMYALMGLFVGLLAFMRVDVFTFSLIVLGTTLFLAGLTVIAESVNLLFGVEENDVLGHRPIHPRTLLLSKALSLFGLTLLLMLALNLFPMFFGLAARGAPGWFPLTHLLTIALEALFCAGAVVFVYALLTRLVGRERFDSIATWSQVGVSVLFIFGYQIIPRVVDRAQGLHIRPTTPFLALLPPAWFASLDSLLAGSGSGPAMIGMAATGLAVTALLSYAAVGRLASDYAARLASLSETPVRASKARALPGRSAAPRPMHPLLRAWMRDPVERGAFRLAAAYMRRDREIRMRLYPSLASILVFPLLPLLTPDSGSVSAPLLTVFMAGTLPMTALMTLKVSAQHAAADVFHFAPLRGTAPVFHGVRKAAILYLMLPALAVSWLILWSTVRDHERLLMTLPALVPLPTYSLIGGLMGDYLPLSVPPTVGRQGAANLGAMLIGGLSVGLLTALAWVARRHGWFWHLVAVETVVVAIVHLLLLRGIRARPLARG